MVSNLNQSADFFLFTDRIPLIRVSTSRWSEKKFGIILGHANGFRLFNMIRPREKGRSRTGTNPKAG